MWKKLLEHEDDYVQRGALLTFPAGHPFEGQVVVMVCEHRAGGAEFPFCLVTITGYKAGINPMQALPAESKLPSGGIGLSRDWLIRNWTKWVWPEGDAGSVLIREPLDVSELFTP
jgi:hypothetical protein